MYFPNLGVEAYNRVDVYSAMLKGAVIEAVLES